MSLDCSAAMHRVLHIDDPERIAEYRKVLGLNQPPPRSGAARQQRLLTMLALTLFGKRHRLTSLPEALMALAANPAVRSELAQLLEIVGDESDMAPQRFGMLDHAPLALHARYTRDEALV